MKNISLGTDGQTQTAHKPKYNKRNTETEKMNYQIRKEKVRCSHPSSFYQNVKITLEPVTFITRAVTCPSTVHQFIPNMNLWFPDC